MNIRTLFALAGLALAGSAIGSGEGPIAEDAHGECVEQCRSTATFSRLEPVAGDGEPSVSIHEIARSHPAVRCAECHRWFDWKALEYEGDLARK